MPKSHRKWGPLHTAAAVLSCFTPGVLAAPSRAQTQPRTPAIAAPASLQEVVVTAQRRAERLQDVPIAITALGRDALARQQIDDVSDLRRAVPGLAISNFGGVNASNLVSIRGVSGQPLPIGAGQATAIYLDGVYLSRPDAGFFTLDDLERIEVLRGPQGTLYGRNATAGAINIITRAPSDELKGGGSISYGDFDSVEAKGFVTGPLANGLAGSLSGSYNTHDGYFINSVDNRRVDGQTAYTLRGKLRYEAGTVDATLAADYSRDNGPQFFKGLITGGVDAGIGDPNKVATDLLSESRSDVKIIGRGVSLTADDALSKNVTLTSITAWRKTNTFSAYDGDGSAVPAILTAADNSSETFSQELRAVLKFSNLRATMGANYYHEDGAFGLSILPPTAPLQLNSPYDTTKLDAVAVFGQAEYDLTKKLSLVGGLRVNYESRNFSVDYRQALPAGTLVDGRVTDSVALPSVGVNYKLSRAILTYAKVNEGYQAPGFNFAPGAAATKANTFKSETLWAYEAGVKSQFLNRRVTLNLAGYYYDYSNIQVRSVVSPGVTLVENAATATIKGAEGELSIQPGGGFTLSGQLSYGDARYGAFCQPISAGTPQGSDPLCSPGVANRSGNRLNQAPEWSGGVNLSYERPVAATAKLKANLGYSFESGVFYSTTNEAAASDGSGWSNVSARLGVTLDNGLEVFAYGKNLTDDRYLGQVFRLSAAIVLGAISDPRTFGIGAQYHF